MFKKALSDTGNYRMTTYAAIAWRSDDHIPYFVVYQLILPLLGYGDALPTGGIIFRIIIAGVCGVPFCLFTACRCRRVGVPYAEKSSDFLAYEA